MTNNKKKILICHFDLGGGGAEKVLINLLNNINYSKYDITLFTIFKTGANVEKINKNVTFKYLFKRQFRGFTTIMKLFSPKTLYRLFIRDMYDIEIAYLEGNPSRIISGSTNKNCKKVAFIHISFDDEYKLAAYRNIDEAVDVYNKFDNLVFVSQTAMDCFCKRLPKVSSEKRVLYNINDIDLINKQACENNPQFPVTSNIINLITIGRFVEQKGYDRLLRLLGRIKKDGLIEKIHLYILGTGALKSSYDDIIKKEGIMDNVTFLGYQDNPYKYLTKSDLFVCSSYREGYSTVATESIILGVPVLTTNCSGMEELLLNGKHGLIVNNDEESLYKGLKRIIENPSMIQQYRDNIKSNNVYQKTQDYVDKYESFIDQL